MAADEQVKPADEGRLERPVGRPVPEASNESGPSGTYGCACTSREAMFCFDDRYGHHTGERCGCLCHEWRDEDDDLG